MFANELEEKDTVQFTYKSGPHESELAVGGLVEASDSSTITVGGLKFVKNFMTDIELLNRSKKTIYSNVDRDFAQQGDVATFASERQKSKLLMYDPKTDILKPWRWLVPPVLRGSVLDDNSYYAYDIRWEENFWGNSDLPRLVIDGTSGKLLP